jgi:hypothetical protein
MNVMVQTELKIYASQESYHILKFICRLQMQKKQIWHTARGPLLSPCPPSMLGPHSPCAMYPYAAILWILHTSRVRALLYGRVHACQLAVADLAGGARNLLHGYTVSKELASLFMSEGWRQHRNHDLGQQVKRVVLLFLVPLAWWPLTWPKKA